MRRHPVCSSPAGVCKNALISTGRRKEKDMKQKKAKGGKVAVTFELPADGLEFKKLAVAGDFNGWSTSANPMRKVKGTWSTTVEIEPGTHLYRFVDETGKWHNDPQAERYEPSGYGEDNCVIDAGQM